MTRIYDIDGTEKDENWLRETWDGCEVLKANIPEGVTEWWKLEAVYCTTGPATLKAELRRDGHQADNQPVVVTWPFLENPSQELETLPSNQYNWAQRGVIQRTEVSGFTGFGLGGGKEYDEKGKEVKTYGPWYSLFVFSSVPSDCLTKTGMRGGTVHDGPLHAVFVLTPVAPGFETIQEAMLYWAKEKQVLQLNPEAALQKALLKDGYIATSPEFDVEHSGKQWTGQRAERQDNGAVRVYWVEKEKWDTVYNVDR